MYKNAFCVITKKAVGKFRITTTKKPSKIHMHGKTMYMH